MGNSEIKIEIIPKSNHDKMNILIQPNEVTEAKFFKLLGN